MRLVSCLFCFLFGIVQFAQAASLPDFGGRWVRAQGESSGPPPVRNAREGMLITQNENSLRIESRLADGSKQIREYIVDGTERNIDSSRNSSYRAQWDGEKIFIDQNRKVKTPFGSVDIKTQETWTLSADGKVLTVSRTTLQNSNSEIKSTQIYNRAD